MRQRMIRDVLKMGDPRLLEKARPVEAFDTPELRALLADMRDTMAHLNGAGLAAPQIGVGLRVVIFGVHRNPRYPDAEEVPDTVLINPVLEPLGDEMEEGWEGCLSVPRHARSGAALHAAALPGVRRARPADRPRRWPASTRVVVQHECDHLDGILYPMRIRDLSKFGFIEALFPGEDIAED